MKIDYIMDNSQILCEIGSRIKQARIRQQQTQAEFAKISGVSKSVLERVEKGESVHFLTVIKILRHLELLGNLENLLPESDSTPIEILRQKTEKKRQRVRKSDDFATKSEWKWGDNE